MMTFRRFRNATFIADIGPREQGGSGLASGAFTTKSKDTLAIWSEDFRLKERIMDYTLVGKID